MEFFEVLCLLGAPLRTLARVLIVVRYLVDDFTSLRSYLANSYAIARFGKDYRWKLWLLYDIEDLERVEIIINGGTDKEVMHFRESYLDAYRLVAVVGALLAQAAISANSLPDLRDATFYARGLFLISLVASLLGILFTYTMYRELRFIQSPAEFKSWLSNGRLYVDRQGKQAVQSSLLTHQLLELPYELIGISITLFVAGIGAYLGSALTREIALNTGVDLKPGNTGVLSVYLASITFGCVTFGTLAGRKTAEHHTARKALKTHFEGKGSSENVDPTTLPRVGVN